MNYLDKAEEELRAIVADKDNPEVGPLTPEYVAELVSFVRKRLLESYKNGAEAAKRANQGQSQGKAGQRGK